MIEGILIIVGFGMVKKCKQVKKIADWECYCPPTIMGDKGPTDFCFLLPNHTDPISCMCTYICVESGRIKYRGTWLPK
jgi:hypothetical protein